MVCFPLFLVKKLRFQGLDSLIRSFLIGLQPVSIIVASSTRHPLGGRLLMSCCHPDSDLCEWLRTPGWSLWLPGECLVPVKLCCSAEQGLQLIPYATKSSTVNCSVRVFICCVSKLSHIKTESPKSRLSLAVSVHWENQLAIERFNELANH